MPILDTPLLRLSFEPANDAASLYEPASRANSEVAREPITKGDPSRHDDEVTKSDLVLDRLLQRKSNSINIENITMYKCAA